MKKILILILLGIVIGLVIFQMRLFKKISAGGSSPSGQSMTIQMTDSGFEPATITIRKGDKVIFKNAGTKPHWPASNLHPTHGIYPEFDPRHGIDHGEEWSFVFKKSGKWKYHDHLSPKVTGIITVTDN